MNAKLTLIDIDGLRRLIVGDRILSKLSEKIGSQRQYISKLLNGYFPMKLEMLNRIIVSLNQDFGMDVSSFDFLKKATLEEVEAIEKQYETQRAKWREEKEA